MAICAVEKKVKFRYLDITMNNIFVEAPIPNESMLSNEHLLQQIGALSEGIKNLQEDIREIKTDVKDVKALDMLINQSDIGIMARFKKIESDVKDIKAYIENQRKWIALISSAAGLGVTGIAWGIKMLITWLMKG